MSKLQVNYEQLRLADTKRLLELEHQIIGSLEREAANRREAKRGGGKKKRGRPRRSSSS